MTIHDRAGDHTIEQVHNLFAATEFLRAHRPCPEQFAPTHRATIRFLERFPEPGHGQHAVAVAVFGEPALHNVVRHVALPRKLDLTPNR